MATGLTQGLEAMDHMEEVGVMAHLGKNMQRSTASTQDTSVDSAFFGACLFMEAWARLGGSGRPCGDVCIITEYMEEHYIVLVGLLC